MSNVVLLFLWKRLDALSQAYCALTLVRLFQETVVSLVPRPSVALWSAVQDGQECSRCSGTWRRDHCGMACGERRWHWVLPQELWWPFSKRKEKWARDWASIPVNYLDLNALFRKSSHAHGVWRSWSESEGRGRKSGGEKGEPWRDRVPGRAMMVVWTKGLGESRFT